MSNKMKCYVCYRDDGHEGHTEPQAVYWYEKDAKIWVKQAKVDYMFDAYYKEMEIE